MSKKNNHEGYSDKTRKNVEKYAKKNGSFTRNELQDELGHNWITIQNILRDLQNEKKLEVAGKSRNTIIYRWVE